MSDRIIEKKICLEPKFLDNRIEEHLLRKLKTEYLNSCDQENGYITKIYDRVKVLDNMVSNTSSVVYFDVRFTVKTILPKENERYTGKIKKILDSGILVVVFGKMKVILPEDKLGAYKYDKSTNSFFLDKKTKLEEGDEVKIELLKIKYEKQNFSCIGLLVQKI